MVLSSTISIVLKKKYGQEMPQPTHGTVRKRHKVGIAQALTAQYRYSSKIVSESDQVPFLFNVNKICPNKTNICLDIGPALLL